MNNILIDLGSSTVKVYTIIDDKIKLTLQKSIIFKNNFDPDKGISDENKKELFELIDVVKKQNDGKNIKIYSTGIFRKLSQKTKISFIDEFFIKTGLFLNIISQDLENFYLEMALMGKCFINEPVLLINIGGNSTELVIMYGEEAIERYNIDLGAGTIYTEFPTINDNVSGYKIENIIEYIKNNLPNISNEVTKAFYTGGELNYMNLTKYPLEKNNLFDDIDHPSVLSVNNFCNKNKEIFEKISLNHLESLMPDNPKWMLGAKSCSAIAQAICEKYNIKLIIPSDSNIINGIVRRGFRSVTLGGSFRKHLEYILKIKEQLEKNNIKVLSPRFVQPKNPGDNFVIFTGEEDLTPLELVRHYFQSIAESDALIVCDPEGYVGASTLVDIGYANSLGKRIIFTEKPKEFILNTLPAEIGM